MSSLPWSLTPVMGPGAPRGQGKRIPARGMISSQLILNWYRICC